MALGSTIEDYIVKSGLPKGYIAKTIGITTRSLTNKLTGKTEFTAKELRAIITILRLTKTQIADLFLPCNSN